VLIILKLYIQLPERFLNKFSAELFGVKKILPAYLDPNLKLPDLLTGVSFASGGAGYDPLPPFYIYI